MACHVEQVAVPTPLARATLYKCGDVLTITGYKLVNLDIKIATMDNHRQFWEIRNCMYIIEGKVEAKWRLFYKQSRMARPWP